MQKYPNSKLEICLKTQSRQVGLPRKKNRQKWSKFKERKQAFPERMKAYWIRNRTQRKVESYLLNAFHV